MSFQAWLVSEGRIVVELELADWIIFLGVLESVGDSGNGIIFLADLRLSAWIVSEWRMNSHDIK
jgi:hypothetical protein